MIMIVLLLGNLNNLYCLNNVFIPTGEDLQDSCKVLIPISYIKLANSKLIERNNLLLINKQQDSIIVLKNKYIQEQYDIIKDFQNKLNEENNINNKLKDKLEKDRKRNNIIKYGAIGAIIGLTITLICK